MIDQRCLNEIQVAINHQYVHLDRKILETVPQLQKNAIPYRNEEIREALTSRINAKRQRTMYAS